MSLRQASTKIARLTSNLKLQGHSSGHWRPISHLRDMRQSRRFREVEDYFRAAYAPAFGRPSQASQPSACPTHHLIAVKAGIRKSLEAGVVSCISIIDTITHQQTTLTGEHRSQDTCPQWSPDGEQLALLSNWTERGRFGLFIYDTRDLFNQNVSPSTSVLLPGNPEAISWSADGAHLLIRVADHGADQAAGYGSDRLGSQRKEDEPSWAPDVETSDQEVGWRSLWVYEQSSAQLRQIRTPGLNVWEAVWLGNDRLLAVVSDSPTEDAWYEATLATVDVQTGEHRTVYRPPQQLGVPAATPSGLAAAFVECLSSDRGGVAGEVILMHTQHANFQKLSLNAVDVTHVQWVNEDTLSFMGLRGTQTVAGHYHRLTGQVEEHWVSDQTCGPIYPEGAVTKDGAFAIVSEGWGQYQQLIIAHRGKSHLVLSWAHEGSRRVQSLMEPMLSTTWRSTDGLEIQGYLTLPPSNHAPPHPLILNLHGGPVWTFRNHWCLSSPLIPLLNSQGYAVLSANQRGSAGQGPEFAAKVLGDLGGMDAQDLLAAVKAMVERGIADEDRVGVMGVSYGGYMAAWLPTLSPCFRAAVPIAPITNWYSNHNTSNIGKYDELFLQADPHEPGNIYHHRSPVMFAGRHPTPVMQITGGKDRCVPPSQAVEYHRALKAKGRESVLVTYPGEGHGIRQYPAYIDFCARVLDWFDRHLAKR